MRPCRASLHCSGRRDQPPPCMRTSAVSLRRLSPAPVASIDWRASSARATTPRRAERGAACLYRSCRHHMKSDGARTGEAAGSGTAAAVAAAAVGPAAAAAVAAAAAAGAAAAGAAAIGTAAGAAVGAAVGAAAGAAAAEDADGDASAAGTGGTCGGVVGGGNWAAGGGKAADGGAIDASAGNATCSGGGGGRWSVEVSDISITIGIDEWRVTPGVAADLSNARMDWESCEKKTITCGCCMTHLRYSGNVMYPSCVTSALLKNSSTTAPTASGLLLKRANASRSINLKISSSAACVAHPQAPHNSRTSASASSPQ
jgi:hypothetical protein